MLCLSISRQKKQVYSIIKLFINKEVLTMSEMFASLAFGLRGRGFAEKTLKKLSDTCETEKEENQ